MTVAAATAKAGLPLSAALPGWPVLAILSAPGATLRAMDTLSDKKYGLWRVAEDDPDSDLYAESSDADTVIGYITAHS